MPVWAIVGLEFQKVLGILWLKLEKNLVIFEISTLEFIMDQTRLIGCFSPTMLCCGIFQQEFQFPYLKSAPKYIAQ